jgi:serine/threonine-protein kinase RsbW
VTTAAEFELEVAARAESVPLVRHALRGLLSTLDVGDARTADIALAVTEACTNVVLHAYPDRPGALEVRAAEHAGQLAVTVRDHGAGMAPRVDSPGLGVGLPVIAAIADAVTIGAPAGGGTEVTMRFDLRSEAA